MLKKISAIILSALLLLSGCSKDNGNKKASGNATGVSSSENMVKNGTFDANDTSPWLMFMQTGSGTMSVDNGELKVNVSNSGSLNYAVQIYMDLPAMYKNAKYKLTFDAHSTIERDMETRIQINGGDYHPYFSDNTKLTTSKKSYEYEFEMKEDSDPSPRFVFNMGQPESAKDKLKSHDIFFDNITLTCTDSSKAEKPKPNENLRDINVNQIGYKPDYSKIAVARGDIKGKEFKVINKDTGKEVKKGKLDKSINSKGAKEDVYQIDFTDVKDEGTYYIQIGDSKSYDFKISNDVYNDAYKDSFKMLYTQRCGMELTKDLAGDFAHPACHTEQAIIYGTNDKIDVSGGWHDAGDYGKYVVAGAKTVSDLLLAYDMNKDIYTDDMGIPESGNNIPDILDEAKYEIDWMLKMQNPSNGGVYHKVTTAAFPGVISPDSDKDQLYVYPISQTATADFAAVMALSSKIYQDIDKPFADKCLDASIKAFDYVKDNIQSVSFKNPTDCLTGEYPDGNVYDEQGYAGAALYYATQKSEYLDYALKKYATDAHGLGWADVSTYSTYLMIKSGLKEVNESEYNNIYGYMKKRADKMVTDSEADGYFSTLGTNYYWGSNMGIANDAMFLIMMNNIEKNDKYIATSRNLMNYLFGTNTNSISYVTGYGTYTPLHPHHRMSQLIGTPVKGMLVGGPDSHMEDPYAKATLIGLAPAKCYTDNDQSYSTNEVTIYWNSPLIFDLMNIN